MLDDETLRSYLDATLPADARKRVEAAIAADRALAERVARHQALEKAARASFAEDLAEPIPNQWIAAIDNVLPAAGNVARMAVAREHRRTWWSSWQTGGAVAAALVLGVLVGRAVQRPESQIAVERAGALMASTPVADALDKGVSGVSVPLGGNRTLDVQLSLRAADGRFCREARVTHPTGAQRILVCRERDGWQIIGLAREAVPGGGYQQVSGDGPLDALIDSIEGEPLDAAGEKAAIARGWIR